MSLVVLAGLVCSACGDAKKAVVDPSAPPALRAISVVGCDAGLRLEFVGDLDPRTVTSKTFYVERSAGVTAYDLAGRAVTFVPDEPFTSGQQYAAVLSGDVASIGGTKLATSMRWTFSCFDQSPPVVMERFPQGEDISLLVRPTVRFNKQIDEKTLTPENVRIEGHPALVSYSAAERTATLTPTYRLYPGRKYTVTISPRVRDLSGNELGVTVTWAFRTRAAEDDWAVQMISPPLPAFAACGTPVEFRLSPDFGVDPTGVERAPVAIDSVPNLTTTYDPVSRVIRLVPNGIPFRPGVTYQLVATSALKDKDGDAPFDVGAIVGGFTMLASCDVPTVASVPGASGIVECDSPAIMSFSSAMEEASTVAALSLQDLTAGGFDPERSPTVATSADLSSDGLTASLTPEAPLQDGHRYWFSISGEAKSADGQSLASAGGWEFIASCP